MKITATDFQLRVNEYFTKLMQGEEIIIERYGKQFAVLVPFEEYQKIQERLKNHTEVPQEVAPPIVSDTGPISRENSATSSGRDSDGSADASKDTATDMTTDMTTDTLSNDELAKLLKLLLNK